MTERAKLWSWIVGVSVVATVASCTSGPAPLDAPHATYDARSRRLVRLDLDANRDGRIDQRTYFAAGTAVRTEIDADGDDRIDRWEYVDASAAPTHVGTSSANDGIEDTWAWPVGRSGEVRVDRAQYRDGVIDRREFLQNEVLLRAEEDANRDGLVDKWETWSQGVLQMAAYDSTFSTGRPDRRLVYEGGRFVYLEADAAGNGQFERLASNPPGIRREDP